jgi:hypothetical protein
MKKIITLFIFFILILSVQSLLAQTYKLQEDFETSDSIHLPAGWSVQNTVNYYPDPLTNWTVRDTGVSLPGLADGTGKAHDGIKSCGVSWWVSYDTSGSQVLPEAWLVTKKVENIENGDKLKFWASGGSTNYSDSMQIWLSVTDSSAYSMVFQLGSINWDTGSVYGNFTQYVYDLSVYAGLSVYIGFLYNQDCTTNGFYVFLDDVEVSNPIGVQPISGNLPKTYALRQNYPNPFNPTTNFEFDLPKAQYVNIVLYNTLGQQVSTLLNEFKQAGTYKVSFNGSDLPSGTYLYRISAGDFTQTNKMVLVK